MTVKSWDLMVAQLINQSGNYKAKPEDATLVVESVLLKGYDISDKRQYLARNQINAAEL